MICFTWPAHFHGVKTLRLALCDHLIDLLRGEMCPDESMDPDTPCDEDLNTVSDSLDRLLQWRVRHITRSQTSEEKEVTIDDLSGELQSPQSKRRRLDLTPEETSQALTDAIVSKRMHLDCCDPPMATLH